ncbi:MAG TPA: hypothetical protein VK179_09440 [Bacteroidales bacterium]|nr:hypothetical protein [Bacteroidales bacterium]
MKQNRFPAYILALCFLLILASCGKPPVGKLIITKVPSGQATPNMLTGENWRYIPRAVIAIVDPGKASSEKILTSDFYSACSPDISWDGDRIVFAGQKKQSDPWQIYEMNLKSRKYRQVLNIDGNCTDPVFLPLDKVIFTKNVTPSDSSLKTGYELYVCNADGSGMQQITFHPYADFATTVLKDGRLLVVSKEIAPEQQNPSLVALRPDGTKADIFYKGAPGTSLISRSHEADEKVYFIESDANGKSEIISVRYNRPLHSRQQVSSDNKGNFSSVFPSLNGNLLVTYNEGSGSSYAVYELDKTTGKPVKNVFSSNGFDVVDALQVDVHQRPKKLPSEVDMGVKTGLIMCQDINFKGIGIMDPLSKKAVKIEVMGIDSSLGIIPVESDGSVYLKIIADMPFRIQTLDERNKVVYSGSDWLWLRPNERRGFVGFGVDEEVAPMNRVPKAVKKDPVSVPVIKMFEKEVELE